MSRILILTAGFGEGHNAAARNLAEAFDASGGKGFSKVVDLFELASPKLNKVSRRAYLSLINRAPRLWSGFYSWVDRSQVLPRHLWFLRKETKILAGLLQDPELLAVCSTYPVYGFMADRLRETGLLRVPFHNIVTDSISINTLWTRPSCDSWFVPNPETGEVLASQGVKRERIHASGFPVQGFFARHLQDFHPPDLAADAKPRVLYLIHSGVMHAEATARRLLKETDWELTLAVGRDEALRKRLEGQVKSRTAPTTLLSWTDQIPKLLLTHNAVISKAGGATTQEAIAARCPMIVNQIVPGQEEGNYELLRSRGIGALATTPEGVIAALQGAFENKGSRWAEWRRALGALSQPEAAKSIAWAVLNPKLIQENKSSTHSTPTLSPH